MFALAGRGLHKTHPGGHWSIATKRRVSDSDGFERGGGWYAAGNEKSDDFDAGKPVL